MIVWVSKCVLPGFLENTSLYYCSIDNISALSPGVHALQTSALSRVESVWHSAIKSLRGSASVSSSTQQILFTMAALLWQALSLFSYTSCGIAFQWGFIYHFYYLIILHFVLFKGHNTNTKSLISKECLQIFLSYHTFCLDWQSLTIVWTISIMSFNSFLSLYTFSITGSSFASVSPSQGSLMRSRGPHTFQSYRRSNGENPIDSWNTYKRTANMVIINPSL